MDDYAIRTMTRPEVDLAVEWAAAEGWNPGLDDAACFHAADPGGFLVGLLGEKPVAAISVVRYGASFGFLGFYIVRPEYRGRGYGLRIWNAGMARLAGRTIGLDGVVAQQENYRKSGFSLAYRNCRYEGRGGGGVADGAEIVPLSSLSFAEIQSYDKSFFPDDRTAFLACWIAQPRATALGYVKDGRLVGYGLLRPCRSGYKIGPLFAERPEWADALFGVLRAQITPADPLFLDVPAVNPEAVDLAKRHGMSIVFETARMYAGKAPELPLDRLFGVTSFELG